MIGHQVGARWRHHEGEAFRELQRRQHQRSSSVRPGAFEVEDDAAVMGLLETCLAQGGPSDVPTQSLQAFAIVGTDAGAGVQVEAASHPAAPTVLTQRASRRAALQAGHVRGLGGVESRFIPAGGCQTGRESRVVRQICRQRRTGVIVVQQQAPEATNDPCGDMGEVLRGRLGGRREARWAPALRGKGAV